MSNSKKRLGCCKSLAIFSLHNVCTSLESMLTITVPIGTSDLLLCVTMSLLFCPFRGYQRGITIISVLGLIKHLYISSLVIVDNNCPFNDSTLSLTC